MTVALSQDFFQLTEIAHTPLQHARKPLRCLTVPTRWSGWAQGVDPGKPPREESLVCILHYNFAFFLVDL